MKRTKTPTIFLARPYHLVNAFPANSNRKMTDMERQIFTTLITFIENQVKMDQTTSRQAMMIASQIRRSMELPWWQWRKRRREILAQASNLNTISDNIYIKQTRDLTFHNKLTGEI